MIMSMTGFGRAEVKNKNTVVTAEIRSVNNRYLDITIRLPKSQSNREGEAKELLRNKLERGKINLSVNIENKNDLKPPLIIDTKIARYYLKILTNLTRTLKIDEKVTLEHLLKISELIKVENNNSHSNLEWKICQKAINIAIDNLLRMREQEGKVIKKDLTKRINLIENYLKKIVEISKKRIPIERKKLREKINKMLTNNNKVDENRLEQEILFLADRLDITEECVRLKSHTDYFLKTMDEPEHSGRKLNFLIQEINREANTIGTKSNDSKISHLTIDIKEELERIREQLQNIE